MMKLFPMSIATGVAFCNRTRERKLLKDYVKNGRHVVLIAPRRYGKTSLANQVIKELKFPYAMMEFTLATSAADVEQIIVNHVSRLLYTIFPRASRAKQNLLNLFKWLNPELVLTAGGKKLVLHPEHSGQNAIDNLSGLLLKLNDAAKLVNKRVIVVMDEFQQLSEIKEHAVEAAIRHAMQYSEYVSYIFSGSYQHVLLSMFNDRNRPFYNSCEIMKLDRISEADYTPFIQSAAKNQWGKPLTSSCLNKIYVLSEFHPSYINRICGHFWTIKQYPTPRAIASYWDSFIETKRAEYKRDLTSLSKNQLRLLVYLAEHTIAKPGSQAVCQATSLSEASIRQAMQKLLQLDYLYKNKKGIIRVLDPAFRDFILRV